MKIVSKLKMNNSLKDEIGNNNGIGFNISYTSGVYGGEKQAAYLNGEDSYIKIPHSESLPFGKKDCFIGMWIKFPDETISFGDILSKFDEEKRVGFNLTVNGTSGGYTAISDVKSISFSVDSGTKPTWKDCGKPSINNTLISSMCVFNGDLYVGISDEISSTEACKVYRYAGEKQWIDCGRVGLNMDERTVFAMVVHQGRLYASTGIWDWEKALNKEGAIGRVYYYEGGGVWKDCGQIGLGQRVMSLASHQGDLYASTDSSEVYRYLGNARWEFCGGDYRPKSSDPKDIFRIDTLISNGVKLYGGGRKRVFEYKGGTIWECIANNPFGVLQVHKLQYFKGLLHAGTWPHGKVLRFGKDLTSIEDIGELGIDTNEYQINEVNDLVFYNGKLYAGTIPKAELYRYDGDYNWKKVGSLIQNEDFSPKKIESWSRIPSMAVYNGSLYASVSSCHGRASKSPHQNAGRIFAMQCGYSVSNEEDIGRGWHHIMISLNKNSIVLYLDGKKIGKTCLDLKERLDISNNKPLLIGAGNLKFLNAAIGEIIIGDGKITETEVMDIYNGRGFT